jgi:hypothetical protein
MGSGRWDSDAYTAAENYRRHTGKSAFDYNDRVLHSTPRNQWRAHPSLDPYGVTVRESRDSAEHPESLAIAVLFDVTGSMGSVPRVLQSKLADLFGLLLRKGYVRHPQIMFGAIGDAYSDRVPLQIGQFESDNRTDQHLGNIVLEGGGGGQMRESYELAMHFMARHTAIDCHEKRGKRGYLFIIGDEMAYPTINPSQVLKVLGRRSEATSIEQVVSELTRKYDTYYILPEGASYAGNNDVIDAWRALLGQNVIQLDDLGAVCETIALTVGLGEGTIDLAAGIDDLREIGSGAEGSVARALGRLAGAPARGTIARGTVTHGATYTYDSDAWR